MLGSAIQVGYLLSHNIQNRGQSEEAFCFIEQRVILERKIEQLRNTLNRLLEQEDEFFVSDEILITSVKLDKILNKYSNLLRMVEKVKSGQAPKYT